MFAHIDMSFARTFFSRVIGFIVDMALSVLKQPVHFLFVHRHTINCYVLTEAKAVY